MKEQPNPVPRQGATLAEIDALFNSDTAPLKAPFDAMIAYQTAEGIPLEGGPSEAIQNLLDAWSEHTGGDFVPDWEAARKRAQGAKPHAVGDPSTFFQRIRNQNNPYSSVAAKAAQEDARLRLPHEHAVAAMDALTATGADFPNHNLLTLAHAFVYADLGLHVVDGHALDGNGNGTGPGGQSKVPRGAAWQQRATTAHSAIIAAWTGDGAYPADKNGMAYKYAEVNAPRNVCIAFPEGCGLFVLDIDGEDGRNALESLEAKHGPLPVTWKSETGSGGLHLVFRTESADIRNTASEIAPGVDIRGKNGQIVAPPSIHPSGKFYRWADGCAPWECDVAEAPEWLRELSYKATKGREAKPKAKKKKNNKKAHRTGTALKTAGDWEEHLNTIGDGLKGFHAPINATALAYFAQNGVDAEESPLKEALLERILAATCKDNRAINKYATADYLDERIEGARAYIKENGEPEPVSLNADTISERAAAAGLNKDSSESDIRNFMTDLLEEGADITTQARATEELVQATGLGKRQLNSVWSAARERLRVVACNETYDHPVIGEWDFSDVVEYAENRIEEVNSENPFMFEYMDNAARVYPNSKGKARIEILSKDAFFSELSKVTTFRKNKTTNEKVVSIKISPPEDVVKAVWGGRNPGCLPLQGVIGTPVFTNAGVLITTPGYHRESGLYYQPDDMLDVPKVSKVPTEEEVEESKRLLIEEVLGDFPLGGLTRDEIVEQALHGEGVPAVTHIIGMLLLMFCRDMVRGPTPGHLLTKPSPGTGASLLTDVCTTIANGEQTAPMTLPPNDEEMQKTLITAMSNGSTILYFDNIDKDVNSGVLASAMTAPKVQGRMLGYSKMLEAEVRCVWVLCGNNVRLSDELIRRLVMVDLDARMEHPEDRKGCWRHEDIIDWVTQNRGRLVWACLTLVQHWIAEGRPLQNKNALNSYENWSRVIGGIVEAAGLGGFLANREHLKESAATEADETLRLFLAQIAKRPSGTKFRAGSVSGGAVSIMDLLNEGCEENGHQPFKMTGWGYSRETGHYEVSGAIGRKFRELAEKPHTVTVDGKKVKLSFKREEDTKNGTHFYVSDIEDA